MKSSTKSSGCGSLSVGSIFIIILAVTASVFYLVFLGKKIKQGKAGGQGKGVFSIFKRTSNSASEPIATLSTHVDYTIQAYFNEEMKSGCLSKGKFTVTDSMYEKLIIKQLELNATKEIALKTLGISLEDVNKIEPICLKGYEMEPRFVSRFGQDGRFRTSQYSVTWIFFSDKQVYVFNFFEDFLYEMKKVSTREYFYKDITSITTKKDTSVKDETSEKKGCLKSKTNVNLITFTNDQFCITVAGDSFLCSMSGVSDIDKVIYQMKKCVRERKN